MYEAGEHLLRVFHSGDLGSTTSSEVPEPATFQLPSRTAGTGTSRSFAKTEPRPWTRTQVSFDIRNFFFGQKQLRGTLAGDIEDLCWGLEQVRAGKLRPALDRSLPLSEAAEAHRLVSTNQITGSVALLPW